MKFLILKNPESKLDGNEGILKRKSIVVSRIIHIGKESNDLDKVRIFGLDSNSYVVYEDLSELERKFREFSLLILELNPKDVKKFGISRQTLWNVKQKIKQKESNKQRSLSVGQNNILSGNNVNFQGQINTGGNNLAQSD